MFLTLNDYLVKPRLLLSLEVTEWTSNSVDNIILLLHLQVFRMLLVGRWRPELIRIRHHSGMRTRLLLFFSIEPVLRPHANAWTARAASAASSRYLPARHPVSSGSDLINGLVLVSLLAVVVEVVEEEWGLLWLHLLGQKLFDVLFFWDLNLEGRDLLDRLCVCNSSCCR